MNGAKVGVFKKTNEVRLSGLLKSKHGRALESELLLELVSDFSHESLERELSDQKIGGLLVLSNFSESDGTWSISVRLLDTASSWGALSGSLGGELLSWGLGTGGFSGSLLGSGHCEG